MTQPNTDINLTQIKSFCVVFPDSCTILNFVLNEEEFKPKIDYFRKVVASGIPCELLPKVNSEITKKLTTTVSEFVNVLKKCRFHFQSIVKISLEKVPLNKQEAERVELSFSRVYVDLQRKFYSSPEAKSFAIRRARVVETSVMDGFAQILHNGQSLSMKVFFDSMEKAIGTKYAEFCSRQSLLMKELSITPLTKNDIHETEASLEKMFLQSCNVHNWDDRILLCEAFGRMYKIDKWGAVVTTDYSDIIRNRMAIAVKTQLIVSDPLYFTYRFEKKVNFALHPQQGAIKDKLLWKRYIKAPPNIGVV